MTKGLTHNGIEVNEIHKLNAKFDKSNVVQLNSNFNHYCEIYKFNSIIDKNVNGHLISN